MGGSVPDIPGVKADARLAASFKYEVAGLLGRQATTFPGAQPVSFASRHLLELQKEDYYVCEKTDGIRCLMYLTNDADQEVVYLIDRKNEFYHVSNLHFPLEGDNPEAFHTKTLLDGELVNDTEADGTIKMKYLVFDCLIMDGSNLMHRTLDKRLAYFRTKLFLPYKQLYDQYPQELDYVPFTIHFKHQELGYAIQQMFDSIIPALKHGSDGLIFTCRNSPYTPGTDQHILKWKHDYENSIDFRMNLEFPMVDPVSPGEEPYPDYNALPLIRLTVFGGADKDIEYGILALTGQEWENLKNLNEPLDERIVECTLDKSGRWRFLRFRDDKKESNYISTVESVMESIRDAVSKQELINQQGKIRDEWKRRQAEGERQPAPRPAATSGAHQGEAGNETGGVKRKYEGNGTDAAYG